MPACGRQGRKITGHKTSNLNMDQGKALHHKITFVLMLVFMGCMSSQHELHPKPDGMVIATTKVLVTVIVVL